MIQVRDDWICLPGVVTRIEYRINVMAVDNIHHRIIGSDGFRVFFVQNSGADYFLIRTRRMRVLLSKELAILKNSPWFFDVSVYEIIKYNGSHCHFTPLCKPDNLYYLLSVSGIDERIEQLRPGYDKNIKLSDGLTVDFLLFALSGVPERQISTTIITLLRLVVSAVIVMEGLRHFLCWRLSTGNEPVALKMGLVISICRAQGKIGNEYVFVFVFVFMIGFASFTLSFASISESEHPVARQSSYFQPEDKPCDGH